MSEIRVSPVAQLGLLGALLALVLALIALELPEIRRYLRIRSM
jgi:hypothetical protein